MASAKLWLLCAVFICGEYALWTCIIYPIVGHIGYGKPVLCVLQQKRTEISCCDDQRAREIAILLSVITVVSSEYQVPNAWSLYMYMEYFSPKKNNHTKYSTVNLSRHSCSV